MSFTELLEKVVTLTSDERKELLRALHEAERQDKSQAKKTENESNGKPFKTMFDVAADIIGSVDSGLGDLSTNKKYMEGFGRDRNRNY